MLILGDWPVIENSVPARMGGSARPMGWTGHQYFVRMQQAGSYSEARVIDAEIVWDLDDDPEGNVQHIAEHGVTVEEVEDVLYGSRTRTGRSRSSGRPQAFGWTSTGKHIAVIWEEVCDDPRMIYPVTAYEVPPPQGRQR
jgi:uncharacterized DUF497 family protein